MKKKTLKRSNTRATRRSNNQRGSIKNWFSGMNTSGRQRVKLVSVLGIAIVGTFLVASSLAAAKPRYFGNSDYWAGRVRACESGKGVWGDEDYEASGNGTQSGAYMYTRSEWSNFGGFSEAKLAPPAVQDDKFLMDWNDSNIGSKRWEISLECWKPAGTIKGAPCLPVPKNPTEQEIKQSQENQIQLDDQRTDLCCEVEFGYPPPETYKRDE